MGQGVVLSFLVGWFVLFVHFGRSIKLKGLFGDRVGYSMFLLFRRQCVRVWCVGGTCLFFCLSRFVFVASRLRERSAVFGRAVCATP